MPQPSLTSDQKQTGLQRLHIASLIHTNRVDQAHAMIQKLPENDRAELLVAAGNAYLAQENIPAAVNEFRAALASSPQHSAAHDAALNSLLCLAARAVEQKAWQDANGYLREALQIDPNQSLLHRAMGAVQGASIMAGLTLDHYDEVIPALENMLKKDPSQADITHQLAILYHRQAIEAEEKQQPEIYETSWNRAIALWVTALEADAYWETWKKAREDAYQREIPAEEIEKMRRETLRGLLKEIHTRFILAYSEANETAHVSRHQHLLAHWSLEFSGAHALYDTVQYLKGRGKTADIPFICGPSRWQDLKLQAKIEKIAQDALKLDKTFQPAQDVLEALGGTGLAKALISEGQLDEAITLLQDALKANPKDQSARTRLADALVSKGQALAVNNIENALAAWDKARENGADKKKVEDMMLQAILKRVDEMIELDATNEAAQLLNTGLKYLPQNRWLKDKLGEMANKGVQEKVKEAIRIANNAINNFTPGVNFEETRRNLNRAIEILETAHRSSPSENLTQRHLNDMRAALANLGRGEANRLNSKGVQLANEAQESFVRGDSYTARSKFRDALNYLEQARSLDPADDTIRQNIIQVTALRDALQLY
ncbi:MAG TPA: tetratricopeptide repeat protein [Anaerolineaceae bacterium]|nr:tetratricopeptide repeat protein [Anaerolineaceae bacterium]HPN50635.1 tetratricopeptide repeat protein [Anaerolineaceae bacterium]